MAQDRPVSLYQQPEQESLSLQSRFKFQCHEGLACFNRCCRTPTIALSPYDILQLKQSLGLTSGEFLRRYTLEVPEEFSQLPLVFLDAFHSPGGGCPFVSPAGCKVYRQRPAACRLFPITMGSRLTNAGVVDYYFCRRLDYCRGFAAETEWTVAAWQANQGFAEYDQGRREWLEILLRAGLLETPVEKPVRELVSTAAYDLDAFRQRMMEPEFLADQGLEGPALENLRSADDLTLLQFSYRYVRALIFTEEDGMG